ncbi:glycosyltransferase family 2 protein [Bacteroides zoogleoformans]|uniref:glycosyltransferase family 2 protein n=1 Tax=Bacteroides zoogleoformans TaxID=28119 RepID=UPI00248ED55D|nr:glycosyltransferase family 2 protein [Bacteroides zoogleoformans]
MSWYEKYMQVYEKNYDEEAFRGIVSEVRDNLQKLQSETPLVTVSVIAYNEEKHLLACLWTLSEQKTKYPIEIIGVNNDSNDKTSEIFKASGIPFYTEYQRSCGYARLCGLTHAKGKYHINIDADTLYPPYYVDTVIDVMESSANIVAVSANWGYIPSKHYSRLDMMLYETLRNLYLRLQSVKRPELSVRGLVFSYRTVEARKIGIRVDIIRGEDGMLAFGLRKYGKIAFLYDGKVRAITGYGTIGEGMLWKRFWLRVKQILSKSKGFFFSARKHEDKEHNLVDKQKEKI